MLIEMITLQRSTGIKIVLKLKGSTLHMISVKQKIKIGKIS